MPVKSFNLRMAEVSENVKQESQQEIKEETGAVEEDIKIENDRNGIPIPIPRNSSKKDYKNLVKQKKSRAWTDGGDGSLKDKETLVGGPKVNFHSFLLFEKVFRKKLLFLFLTAAKTTTAFNTIQEMTEWIRLKNECFKRSLRRKSSTRT